MLRKPMTIAQRVAVIDTDLERLGKQLRDAQLVIEDARQAKIRGQQLTHDADVQREYAELTVEVLTDQINQQLEARRALVPAQRKASEGS